MKDYGASISGVDNVLNLGRSRTPLGAGATVGAICRVRQFALFAFPRRGIQNEPRDYNKWSRLPNAGGLLYQSEYLFRNKYGVLGFGSSEEGNLTVF